MKSFKTKISGLNGTHYLDFMYDMVDFPILIKTDTNVWINVMTVTTLQVKALIGDGVYNAVRKR